MTRILLDANAPIGLRNLLSGCEVVTARYMGWDKLLNGELIARAEAGGFDILITADRNIRYSKT